MATETRRVWRAAALAAALLTAGCGEHEEPPPFGRHPIKLDAVPAPVIGAARKALPEISFEEAWENPDRNGKVVSYEVRGRARNGKIREVRVGTDGKVLETE